MDYIVFMLILVLYSPVFVSCRTNDVDHCILSKTNLVLKVGLWLAGLSIRLPSSSFQDASDS